MIYEMIDPRELKIKESELAARLSAPYGAPVDKLDGLYETLISVARPAYVAARVKLTKGNGGIYVGGMRTASKALLKLCEDSGECIVMAATLGIGVDRLVIKKAQTSAAEAFVTDAMADALVEALCDLAEERLCRGLTASGRFSPGYADLELEMGEGILALTEAERLLGIKLTNGGMMIPKKSVNAIIAIRDGQYRGE